MEKEWKQNGIDPETMRIALNKQSQSMWMPDPKPRLEVCAHHKPTKNKGYDYGEDKFARGCEQRQCDKCKRWFFYGEFGKGWGAGIKQKTR